MSHFSLQTLVKSANETFRRFPFPILFALAATVSVIFVVQQEPSRNSLPLAGRLAMASYLGMLLAISVSLVTERFAVKRWQKGLTWSAEVIFVVLYFLSLPSTIDGMTLFRFGLLAIAFHLLVAFAPFILRSEMNGLWQYNKTLFIRILTSGMYSGVLNSGLGLAILAIENLFDVHIGDKFYADQSLIIAGIFNTWFFLSGVPENIPALERTTDYPKGLKIFTLYVLIPLITVYLVILYAYAGKILITQDWPVGWVANLVIAFSIFGILSFLLVYPLRNDEANPWVRFYSRLFYFLLVPLILLLYVSIFKRIDMYGVTVERYLVVLLAVWLSFIAVFLILTGGNRIRIIPLSLCVIVILATFGPLGAFAVSYRSQINELTTLLDSNHVTINGKVDSTSTHDVKAEDYDRIESIVEYINEMHGHRNLQMFFDQNIDSVITLKHGNYRAADLAVLKMLHINRVETDSGGTINCMYEISKKVMLNSAGYDFVADFGHYYGERDRTTDYFVEADSIRLVFSATKQTIELTYRDYEPLIFDLKLLYASLPNHKDFAMTPDRMTATANNPMWKAKLVFSSLSILREKSNIELGVASGVLMLRFVAEPDQIERPESE